MAKNINIEGAKIIFRNFSGTRFNDGKRNFSIVLDEKDAQTLREEGWNVKQFETRDGEIINHLPVEIRFQRNEEFEHLNPAVWWISGQNRTKLSEKAVGALDQAEIENVDIVIRPYDYSKKFKIKNGDPFIKAQVKSMYVTVEEDAIDAKYSALRYGNSVSDSDDDEVPFD